MSKNSDKVTESRQAPAVHTATRGPVNVFNTGYRQLGQAIRMHDGSPGTRGAPLRVIKFLPGNNKIDADDWEKCKKSKSVKAWLSTLTRLDPNGNVVNGKSLIEDHVNPLYKSTSTDLATRMAAAQMVKRQLST